VTVEYLDLADYIAISSEVTGLDIETVMTSGISREPLRSHRSAASARSRMTPVR
jgi:hypothetical protein